jgi:hypothetical protein
LLVTILIFLVILLAAYVAYALLPPPVGLIVAVVVGVIALIYLIGNLDAFEADAAVASAKAVRSSWG